MTISGPLTSVYLIDCARDMILSNGKDFLRCKSGVIKILNKSSTEEILANLESPATTIHNPQGISLGTLCKFAPIEFFISIIQ